MESPEAFLLKFLAGRNAIVRRHQKELEKFQKEFCDGALIYDKRLAGYEQEQVLDVAQHGTEAEVMTNGNVKGRNAARLRYKLIAADGAWLVSDLRMECPICHGSGKFKCSGPACDVQRESGNQGTDLCKVCKGLGWLSTKKGVEGLLEE